MSTVPDTQSTAGSVVPAAAPENKPPFAAVIYIPGITARATETAEFSEISRRFARQLDFADKDEPSTYEARPAPAEPYGTNDEPRYADVCEIVCRRKDGTERVTHRLYRLNYDAQLADAAADNLFSQFFSVGWLSLKWTVRFGTQAVRAGSLGGREKIALLLGGATLVALIGYLALLFLGVVFVALSGGDPSTAGLGALDDLWQSVRGSETFGGLRAMLDSWIPGGAHGLKVAAQVSTVAAALASFVGLGFGGIRDRLGHLVDMYLRFSRYFDDGHGRAACVGQFNELVEHILEGDAPPTHLDVVGYSMGSVIALDTVFPINGVAMPRAERIRSLATIGCPFDLVRTFWPGYFENRTPPEKRIGWINVYSPVDLLGSNFTNAPGRREKATHGINGADPRKAEADRATDRRRAPDRNLMYDHAGRERMGFWQVLLFGGFRAHAQYWSPGRVDAESCFSSLVVELYPAVPAAAKRG